jgi:hypothetical protein
MMDISSSHRRRGGAIVAAICLLVSACAPSAPSGPPGTLPPDATPAGPPVRAEGIRLVGSLPGSIGDLAFWGDLAVANLWTESGDPARDQGFVVIDVSDPTQPLEIGRFACTESDRDISIWEDLVILSQDQATEGAGCDAGHTPTTDPDAFAGIRVVSIADPANPTLVASVRTGYDEAAGDTTARGSHTHTLVPDLDHLGPDGQPAPRLIVYAGMFFYPSTQPHATIVEVPLDDPSAARVIGTLDNGTPMTCHDFTVYRPGRLAACSAYFAGVILFDISDPAQPVVLSHLVDPNMTENSESHHSTVFSNDGRTLVIDAEIDARLASCAGGTDEDTGALWFYDISDPADPQQRGYFQLPRPGTGHLCYAHQSNVVPMAGDRDIVVTGWFAGGINLVDFTEPAQPRELAYWVSSEGGGMHSFANAAYWYNGHVYAGNLRYDGVDLPFSERGFDVFEVDEPDLADALTLPYANPQTQDEPPEG